MEDSEGISVNTIDETCTPHAPEDSKLGETRTELSLPVIPSSTSLSSIDLKTNSTELLVEKQDPSAVLVEDDNGNDDNIKKTRSAKIFRIFREWTIGPPSRWTLLTFTTLGALMASIQGSALIIALPALMKDLDANIVAILWILNSYSLIIAVAVPLIGRIGDLVGRTLLFNLGFLVFAIASLLCGVAPVKQAKGYDLVAYRVLQGFGSSLIFTNSTPLVTDAFIAFGQLGIAMACNQMAFSAGNVIGPVIGGVLAKASWKWIFIINAPIGGIGFLFGILKIRETNMRAMKKSPNAKIQPKANAASNRKSIEAKKDMELQDIKIKDNQNVQIQETMPMEKKDDHINEKIEQTAISSTVVAEQQQIPEKTTQEAALDLIQSKPESVTFEEQPTLMKSNKVRWLLNNIKEIIYRFDLIGTSIFVISITALLIALSDVAYPCVGLIARRVLFAVFGASLLVFVVFEWFWKSPLIDPRLFFIRPFLIGNVSNSLMSYAQGAIMFCFIFYFQGPGGRSPLMAGVMLMPLGGTITIFGLFAGLLADRIGSQLLCFFGLLISVGGAIGMCFVQANTSYGLIALYFILYGAGTGLYNSPNTAALMGSVPPWRRGTASGTFILLLMIFRAISTAITFVLIFSKLSVQDIIQIFLIGGGIQKSVVNAFMKEWRINMWIVLGTTALAWISTPAMKWDWRTRINACIKARKEAKKAALEEQQEAETEKNSSDGIEKSIDNEKNNEGEKGSENENERKSNESTSERSNESVNVSANENMIENVNE